MLRNGGKKGEFQRILAEQGAGDAATPSPCSGTEPGERRAQGHRL